jgi:hypothetical protein
MVFYAVSDLGRRLWNFLLGFVRRKADIPTSWATTNIFYPQYDLATFSSDYELIRINWEESMKMRYYRRDYVIGSERYIPAYLSGKSRFQTVVEMTVRDVVTGEEYTSAMTVKHNRPLVRAELEQIAAGLQAKYEPRTEVVRAMPSHGYRDLNYPGEIF